MKIRRDGIQETQPVSQATTPWVVSTDITQPTTPADTQPVSAASLPLPTGAATAAKQLPDNHNVTVSNQIDQPLEDGGNVVVSNFPSEYPLPAAQVSTLAPQTDALTDAELRASAIDVDTGLTQPTTPADTQPVSAASLPLPAGAATAAKQLPDNHQVAVSNFPAAQTDALTDAELRATAVDVDTGLTQPTTPSDTQPVSAASLPLPTGAATEAKQDTGNTSLSSIDGKLPDQSGTWGYDSGTAGSISISSGLRVLQITAVAGASGATMTINGGSTVTIPALTSITIEPKGNLTAPSLVFTSTTGYFVEYVS